jgi:hypothetical protein
VKITVKAMTILSAALAVLLAPLCPAFAGQSVPLKPLNQEKIQGEVRVILLRAGKIITLKNEEQTVVTYAIEIPQTGAFSDLSFSSNDEIAFSAKGKAIECEGPSGSTAMGFDDLPRQDELSKPKVASGKAMLAEEIVFRRLKTDAEKVDVKLKFTWRGNKLTFDFKEVALN